MLANRYPQSDNLYIAPGDRICLSINPPSYLFIYPCIYTHLFVCVYACVCVCVHTEASIYVGDYSDVDADGEMEIDSLNQLRGGRNSHHHHHHHRHCSRHYCLSSELTRAPL